MDQGILVSSGQILVKALDAANLRPRLAMWVHNTDTNTWKLWIVPPEGLSDKQEFYRKVAEVITNHRAELGDLSASDVEMVSERHPGVEGIGRFIHAPGIISAHFSGNVFNGFYLPDGIILRSDFERHAAPQT